MKDAPLCLISMTPIWTGHRQRLREYGVTTLLVVADEVAHVKYQQRTATEQLRTLYLAETVAVDMCRMPATARTPRTHTRRMGRERHKGFITRHTVQRDVPEATFISHTCFYLSDYLRESRFLCTFAFCRWALFQSSLHTQRYEEIRTSVTLLC